MRKNGWGFLETKFQAGGRPGCRGRSPLRRPRVPGNHPLLGRCEADIWKNRRCEYNQSCEAANEHGGQAEERNTDIGATEPSDDAALAVDEEADQDEYKWEKGDQRGFRE